MEIYVRDIQKTMIKPYNNGWLVSVVDYVTQKLLISDIILKSFIPPQVRKMTLKLRHICGCEICIIPKDMYIGLNISRTRIVTDLQHKYVGIYTQNSLFSTTSDSYYNNKVFIDGECLHATIKDAAQCITCLPIKANNIINIKCDLGFCDEFTDSGEKYVCL